jgi:phytoene synthase
MNPIFKKIFKNGSKTYYYSSFFFPPSIKEDVFKLYSFVRTADDFVDTIPQKKEEFYNFKKMYELSLEGEKTGNFVIDGFKEVMLKKEFDPKWVDSFLGSMEADLYINSYETIESLREYLHGSAEVVGLMMAKIMNLPPESFESAMHLGRAMQFVNFIRDIEEDLWLGRNYFPKKDFIEHNLESLESKDAMDNPSGFKNFVRRQLNRFYIWQAEAEKGFKHIPKRYLIPIKTASEMYKWTGKVIYKNPFIVYEKKVKPSIPRIVATVGKNTVFA